MVVQVAEQTKDEVLGAEILYTSACLHGCKGEIAEELECLQKVCVNYAVAHNSASISSQLYSLVS